MLDDVLEGTHVNGAVVVELDTNIFLIMTNKEPACYCTVARSQLMVNMCNLM